MLYTVNELNEKIKDGKIFFIAGEEKQLDKLIKGKWIAGTIPYFMDESGGTINQEKIFATEAPTMATLKSIKLYNENNLENIPEDAAENGFSIIIIPATSNVHIQYSHNAPNFPDLFLKPIIGWISGIHLDDLGKLSPKVFNGENKEKTDKKAIVMHFSLPSNKIASIGIVNLFKQGIGDTITFNSEGFTVKDCIVNGKSENFSNYLIKNNTDTKLPLVANYFGNNINVSFQNINEESKTVDLYAPVFKGVEYKIAKPVENYVKEFESQMKKNSINPVFSCNCILNFLYSELKGKKTGNIIGPITFGEIAYQLLNQTLTYLEIKDI